jgi:long-subunit acyl-CoA synthetase (AMP-forming)
VQGYHRNPEANKATFTADGWLRTGDILCMRGDELFVVDRKKVRLNH